MMDPGETCWTEAAAAKPPVIVQMPDTANSHMCSCGVNPRADSHERSPDANVALCSAMLIEIRWQKMSMLTAHQDVLFPGTLL